MNKKLPTGLMLGVVAFAFVVCLICSGCGGDGLSSERHRDLTFFGIEIGQELPKLDDAYYKGNPSPIDEINRMGWDWHYNRWVATGWGMSGYIMPIFPHVYGASSVACFSSKVDKKVYGIVLAFASKPEESEECAKKLNDMFLKKHDCRQRQGIDIGCMTNLLAGAYTKRWLEAEYMLSGEGYDIGVAALRQESPDGLYHNKTNDYVVIFVQSANLEEVVERDAKELKLEAKRAAKRADANAFDAL